jgi:aryl-alcohol dehydrogenase-like predicted oxidoreductase
MRYKLFGKSGLRVSELGLGAMTFGEEWGWGASKEESRKIFDSFTEAGGNFIDTANKYTLGTSEKFVGDFIASDRDHFVVATKYTLSMKDGDPNYSGNHRKNMIQAVERSLKRLNTEVIDILWVHAWDYTTPVEEIMRGLDDLVRAGKVFYVGISDTPAWRVSQMNTLAELRGWTPFVGLQIKYSLLERTVERDLLPMARAFDLAVTPWAIVGSGVLTGKYNKRGDTVTSTDAKRDAKETATDRNLAIAAEVMKVAGARGVPPAQVAINWVRQQDGVVIPLLGARTDEQIKDNLGCLDFTLTDEEMKKLDDASAIEYGFPHEFLAKEHIRNLTFGGTYDRIDNHHA